MHESETLPITIYRQIAIAKNYEGWSAQVEGLSETLVSGYRYKQEAIDAAIDKARYVLERTVE